MTQALTQPEPNIRFWVYHKDSFVKLTLSPDSCITVWEYEETNEGYSFHNTRYTYDSTLERVIAEIEDGGRDCDGRVVNYITLHCALDKLHYSCPRYQPKLSDPLLPLWTRVVEHVYDQYAQMMGY